jgi:hypothetical protein
MMRSFTVPGILCFTALLILGAAGASGEAGVPPASARVTMPLEAGNASRWILHIKGLKMPPGKSGVIEVYASPVDADPKLATERSNYVGYIAIAPKNSLEIKRGIVANGVIVDLSSMPVSLKSAKEIVVSLVRGKPQSEPGSTEKAGEEKQPSEPALTWERIYVTVQ